MKKYVAGLLFSENENYVALIIKNKPDWQKGLLNGIGGKIEKDDYKVKSFTSGELIDVPEHIASIVAMSREFNEETGVKIEPEYWIKFLTMSSNNGNSNADATNEKTQQYDEGWSVDFYRCFSDKINDVKTMEEEVVQVIRVSDVMSRNTIDNLKWIILLALDKNPNFTSVTY